MADSSVNATGEPADGASLVAPFDDEVDTTLIEVMLRLKLSDRLRTLSRCANGLERLRRL